MQSEAYDITKNLNREEKAHFRKVVVSTVLDTDLAKHFIIMKKFESSLSEDFDLDSEANRLLVMGVTIKCGGKLEFNSKILDTLPNVSRFTKSGAEGYLKNSGTRVIEKLKMIFN